MNKSLSDTRAEATTTTTTTSTSTSSSASSSASALPQRPRNATATARASCPIVVDRGNNDDRHKTCRHKPVWASAAGADIGGAWASGCPKNACHYRRVLGSLAVKPIIIPHLCLLLLDFNALNGRRYSLHDTYYYMASCFATASLHCHIM